MCAEGSQAFKACGAPPRCFELQGISAPPEPGPLQLGDSRRARLFASTATRPGGRAARCPIARSAAAVCRAWPDAGISLDTIVQSERTTVGETGRPAPRMSFTLRRDDPGRASLALQPLCAVACRSFEEGIAIPG